MLFFLGTDDPRWLGRTDAPLFVSARSLRKRKTLPPARGPWALDSGAFTELQRHGRWTVPATQYASEVRSWRDRVGRMAWAAVQDWMCEPVVVRGGTANGVTFAGTGLTVREHQRLTVHSYLLLRQLAPDLPWVPVLQGWRHDDYHRHADDYAAAGVDLAALPLVGVGSVCRRQGTGEIEWLVSDLAARGLRLHAFGLKLGGLARCARKLASSDSMAWSQDARRDAARARRGLPRRTPCPAGLHAGNRSGCNHCLPFALRWRERALAAARFHPQPTLF